MSQREDFAQAIAALQRRYGFSAARNAIEATLLKMGTDGGATRLELEQAVLPETRELITRVSSDYGKIITLANDVYADLGANVSRDMLTIRDLEATQLRDWGRFETALVDSLEYNLRQAALNRETVADIEARIRGIGGKLESVAPTLANHFVKTYGQACKVGKADSAGVMWYAYTGPPPREVMGPHRSHVLCLELYRGRPRTFHRDAISQMRNGQREPVLLNRGGYRCRHEWEPDPFFKPGSKTVSFITVPDGNRDVVVGRYQ